MTNIVVETRHKELTEQEARSKMLKHLVRFDKDTGKKDDKTLCGKPWDVLYPPDGGDICEECIEIMKLINGQRTR